MNIVKRGAGTNVRRAFGGLLALAALLLSPGGEAQARDECGALSSGVATCSNQAYASGIRYDVSDGWNDGLAGDVALTVTGGSATVITSAATTGWGSGIVVRTAPQGSGVMTSRTIALTVGSGGNAVNIAQSSASITGGNDNMGLLVHQRGNRADSTTVTLGSGVAIGTPGTPMKNFGV